MHLLLAKGFGLAIVTTDMEMESDRILAPLEEQTFGPAWWVAKGCAKGALNRDPYRRRRYMDGAYPFEKLKRVEKPTTFIDEERVASPQTVQHVRSCAIWRSW